MTLFNIPCAATLAINGSFNCDVFTTCGREETQCRFNETRNIFCHDFRNQLLGSPLINSLHDEIEGTSLTRRQSFGEDFKQFFRILLVKRIVKKTMLARTSYSCGPYIELRLLRTVFCRKMGSSAVKYRATLRSRHKSSQYVLP